MDNKNVFVAIALSMSVLLFWGAFFETPKKDNQNLNTNNQVQPKPENSISATIAIINSIFFHFSLIIKSNYLYFTHSNFLLHKKILPGL